MKIPEFGQAVLNYILGKSEDGDTVLLVIDDDIYRHEIFKDNQEEINDFETRIRSFVTNNGLNIIYENVQDGNNIAIALAAHQTKLAYDSRTDNNPNAINSALLNFYYPNAGNQNILFQAYYGDDQQAQNYQEQLWKRVENVLRKKNRNAIIPDGLQDAQRNQKFIRAQLGLFTGIKNTLYYLFYRFGFSKDALYTKDEFLQRLNYINRTAGNTITNRIDDFLFGRIRKYVGKDFGTLTLDDTMLSNLLWTLYKSWDGTIPDNFIVGNGAQVFNPIYVELFDEDLSFETQQGNFFYTMFQKGDGTWYYYRLFKYIGDFAWQAEDATFYDIPENDPFVILIKECDKGYFSKQNMTVYHNKELSTYSILYYSTKPDDFFKSIPGNSSGVTVNSASLAGGVKLKAKYYLDFDNSLLLPSIVGKYGQKTEATIQESRIEEYSFPDDQRKIRLHFIKPQDNTPSTQLSAIYNDTPVIEVTKQKVSQQSVKIVSTGKDIQDLLYRANIAGLLTRGGLIRSPRINIVDENSLLPLDEYAGISADDRSLLEGGIGFGWFKNDDEIFGPCEDICSRISQVSVIEFKISKGTGPQGQPAICEFWIKDVANGIDKDEFAYPYDHSAAPVIQAVTIPAPDFSSIKSVQICSGHYISKSIDTPPFQEELIEYQRALCLWIKQKGYATFKEIADMCRVMTQTSKYRADFGERPEYKICIPLFKTGIIDIYNYGSLKNVFVVAYDYDDVRTKAVKQKNKNAVMNVIPTMNSLLKNISFFTPMNALSRDIFIRYSARHWDWQLWKIDSSTAEQNAPFIYKAGMDPWKPDYFYLNRQNIFQINRDNPDATAICKSIINSSREGSRPFSYYPEDEILVCHYFPDLPVSFARALLHNNVSKFSDNELYLCCFKGHYEQGFEHISVDFLKAFNSKYSNQ